MPLKACQIRCQPMFRTFFLEPELTSGTGDRNGVSSKRTDHPWSRAAVLTSQEIPYTGGSVDCLLLSRHGIRG